MELNEILKTAETNPGGAAEPSKSEQPNSKTEDPGKVEGQDNAENKQPTETQKSTEEPKPAQSKQENSEQARARRQREREAELKKSKEDGFTEGFIKAMKENPYTHEPLKDATDVEHYLLMKEIEEKGGDPTKDFAKALKEHNQKEDERRQKARDDIEDFKVKYPTVDLNELGKNDAFAEYCEGKLGGDKSLADLYGQFLKYKDAIVAQAKREAEDNIIMEQAKKNSSNGYVNNNVSQEDDLFSLEDLKKMSTQDILDNYDKVQKSKKKLGI